MEQLDADFLGFFKASLLVFGGIALGTFMCWGLMRALSVSEGFGTFAPSYTSLAVILAVSVVAGIVAAARPARRASQLDVLGAIAND